MRRRPKSLWAQTNVRLESPDWRAPTLAVGQRRVVYGRVEAGGKGAQAPFIVDYNQYTGEMLGVFRSVPFQLRLLDGRVIHVGTSRRATPRLPQIMRNPPAPAGTIRPAQWEIGEWVHVSGELSQDANGWHLRAPKDGALLIQNTLPPEQKAEKEKTNQQNGVGAGRTTAEAIPQTPEQKPPTDTVFLMGSVVFVVVCVGGLVWLALRVFHYQ